MTWLDEMNRRILQAGQGAGASGEPTPAPTPGKSTRVPDPSYSPGPVGHKAIDDDHVCEDETAAIANPECFLSDKQRGKLILAIQHRIIRAQEQYGNAVGEVRVEEYLRPKESPGWLGALLLEGLAMVFSSGLSALAGMAVGAAGKAAKRRPGGDSSDFWQLDVDPDATARVLEAVGKIPTKHLEKTVNIAVGLGKKEVADATKTSPDGKAEALTFLDVMREQAAFVYSNLGENVALTEHGDAGLVQLYTAWDPHNGHTTSNYKRQIQALLASFKKADLDKLGEHELTMGRVDTRTLRWKREFATGRRRLAMFKQMEISYTPGLRKVSTDDKQGDYIYKNMIQSMTFERYIPEDLVDTALDLHRAKFGSEPEEAS